MKKINYHLFWPSGNTTALVETFLDRNRYREVAKTIMNKHVDVEQVGFIETAKLLGSSVHLQMAGNEFCGNAARSLAYWWSNKHNQSTVRLDVSGFDHLLKAQVKADIVKLFLPSEFIVKTEKIPLGYIVTLKGIVHVVADRILNEPERAGLLESYKESNDAVGIMSYTIKDGEFFLDPLVWVREVNTCYSETACGSGTIALSYVANKFLKNNSPIISIQQPSGEILSVSYTGSMEKPDMIILSGKVISLGSYTLFLDLE